MPITKEEHRKRHQELHNYLDELLADYKYYHKEKLISKTTIFELMVWSNEQTENPTEKGE